MYCQYLALSQYLCYNTWKNLNKNMTTVTEDHNKDDSLSTLSAEVLSTTEDDIVTQIRKESGGTLDSSQIETGEETTILTIDSPQIKSFKLSVLSKPNEVQAFIPDLNSSDEELQALELEKEDDGWHVPNRDWFPNTIGESDIVIMYSEDDLGFCSQEEFGRIYANSADYKHGKINYIDPNQLQLNQIIDATKCATGEFCLLQEGTTIETNEGIVKTEAGQAVVVNEVKNSLFATDIQDTILNRYIADPLNPASAVAYRQLEEFCAKKDDMTPEEVSTAYNRLYERFNQIQRSVKLYDIFGDSETEDLPTTLKGEYELASKVSEMLDKEVFERINAMDFETRLAQAKKVLKEIVGNEDLTSNQRNVLISAVKVRLLPKTNSHQHLKGSVPEDVLLAMARAHNFDSKQIENIKVAYAEGRDGFDNLDDFNKAYSAIASAIRTPSDYRLSVKAIIEEAVRQGQLTTEIRCAVLGQRNENGEPLSPDDAIENILGAIKETCEEIERQGGDPPYTGFTLLGYRGKDWKPEEVLEHAELAVKYAKKYPDLKFGFDLAGPEDAGYKPKFFEKAFNVIKEYNKSIKESGAIGESVGVTVHAGETPTCDDMPGHLAVEEALEMGSDRIGHGVQAINSAETMEKLKESKATVEICGVCNVLSIPLNTEGLPTHPIQEFIENDIPITICSDNDAICGTKISKEYMQFLLTGHDSFMNWNTVKEVGRNGIKTAFITEVDRTKALGEFNSRIRRIETLVKSML